MKSTHPSISDYLKHFQSLLDSKIRKISKSTFTQNANKKEQNSTNLNVSPNKKKNNPWKEKHLPFLSIKIKKEVSTNSGTKKELDLTPKVKKVLEPLIKISQALAKIIQEAIAKVDKPMPLQYCWPMWPDQTTRKTKN